MKSSEFAVIISKSHFAAMHPGVKLTKDQIEEFFDSPCWLAVQANVANTLSSLYMLERKIGVSADTLFHVQGAKLALEEFLRSKTDLMVRAMKPTDKKELADYESDKKLKAMLDK